jgi:hypothetical protein
VVAFTLLLFVPQIAFWAYVIAIFMLGKRPRMDAPTPVRQAGSAQGSPAPEFGPRFAPRPGLRTLRVQFRDIELRLRQMEETVTSQEFTLKRALSDARGGRTGDAEGPHEGVAGCSAWRWHCPGHGPRRRAPRACPR